MLLIVTGCQSEPAVDTTEIDQLRQEVNDSQEALEALQENVSELQSQNDTLTTNFTTLTTNYETISTERDALVEEIEVLNANILELTEEAQASGGSSSSSTPANLVTTASEVLLALQADDMVTLETYLHPNNGLKLAPNQNINTSTMIELSHANLLNIATLPTTYGWGYEPGSGNAIAMTAATYFDTYVYDENYYIAPVVGQNVVVSSGNLINNIAPSFPTSSFVEFYFPQFDPQYGGLDWKSLTLVFTDDVGVWSLLAIVNGSWTP